jgi:hypothetical protein
VALQSWRAAAVSLSPVRESSVGLAVARFLELRYVQE